MADNPEHHSSSFDNGLPEYTADSGNDSEPGHHFEAGSLHGSQSIGFGTSQLNGLSNGPGEYYTTLLSPSPYSSQVPSLAPLPVADDPPLYWHSGVQYFSHAFVDHYQSNFLPTQLEEGQHLPVNPQPPVIEFEPRSGNVPASEHASPELQNDPEVTVTELQLALDDAIMFIDQRQIPFMLVLGAGCPNWKQLCGHLSAIAWKHLAAKRLQTRSVEFWESELTRLYCEYVQKGCVFEEVEIQLQLHPGAPTNVITRIDDQRFTEALTTFLASDILRHFVSRLAVAGGGIVVNRLHILTTAENLTWARDAVVWKGVDEGYPLFHGYEYTYGVFAQQRLLYFESLHPEFFLRAAFTPGSADFLGVYKETTGPDGLSYLQPLPRLDMGLVVFGCSVFLTCLDFAANRSRRRADNVWKRFTIENMTNITRFFRRVIAGHIAGVSDDIASSARDALMRLTLLQLE